MGICARSRIRVGPKKSQWRMMNKDEIRAVGSRVSRCDIRCAQHVRKTSRKTMSDVGQEDPEEREKNVYCVLCDVRPFGDGGSEHGRG